MDGFVLDFVLRTSGKFNRKYHWASNLGTVRDFLSWPPHPDRLRSAANLSTDEVMNTHTYTSLPHKLHKEIFN